MLKSHEYDSILSKQSLNVGVVKNNAQVLKIMRIRRGCRSFLKYLRGWMVLAVF